MRILLALTSSILLLVIPARAQTFVPQDVVVSDPSRSLYDMEFDQDNYRYVWQSDQGEDAGTVYVSYVDPVTGLFFKPNGRSQTVGCCAVPIQDTGNGPEWGVSQRGYDLYWSVYKRGKSGEHTVARSEQNLNASTDPEDLVRTPWLTSKLRNINDGNSPTPTKNPLDDQPTVTYQEYPDRTIPGYWDFLWRNGLGTKGRVFPLGLGRKWVPSTRTVLSARCQATLSNEVCSDGNDGRFSQVFTYDVATGLSAQLTFDGTTTKGPPWMWFAPEINDYRFFAQTGPRLESLPIGSDGEQGFRELKVYQKDSLGQWVVYRTITLPGNLIIRSPQPFTWAGKSYISMVGASGLSFETGTFDVYMVRVEDGFTQKVSGPQPIVRNDPEALVLLDSAGNPATTVIYYTQKVADVDKNGKVFYRGVVHKCTTGLVP
ncbi:hypothetical protein [Candidatus Cyanaurora vandensis]|uniref:hypothetical protein n=1 Tax=Candidatus Cyanaurora vandensis TaxID=2714958 RepID=UPI0025797B36|nr:hypothetical protein [Candidatus Cyanaurora vandensis]